MLCEKCKKNQASVHVHQIVNGVKTERHLCTECSITPDMPISFDNLFHGFLDSILSMAVNHQDSPQAAATAIQCVNCGMTYDLFKASGKLGCAECYSTFANELEALLKNVQGSIRHEGKFPQRSGVLLRQKRESDRLRVLLSKAIEDENYEEAARLRDRIRAMEPNAPATGGEPDGEEKP